MIQAPADAIREAKSEICKATPNCKKAVSNCGNQGIPTPDDYAKKLDEMLMNGCQTEGLPTLTFHITEDKSFSLQPNHYFFSADKLGSSCRMAFDVHTFPADQYMVFGYSGYHFSTSTESDSTLKTRRYR